MQFKKIPKSKEVEEANFGFSFNEFIFAIKINFKLFLLILF